jgi:hemin uptake protein HemP
MSFLPTDVLATPDRDRATASRAGPERSAIRAGCIDSRELLGGERELIIVHGDQEYRLRHTQNDKLILTK